MYYRLFIIISLTIFSCKKELNINDFSADFGSYQSELRIEAFILPADNTAIIRIDRSTRLDEGLNDEGYYNCIDDDSDWNYYYCDTAQMSYESRCDCEVACSNNNIQGCEDLAASSFQCIRHLYKCDNDSDSLITFPEKNNCICENGKCVTDDIGTDGKAFDEESIFGQSVGYDEDGSEGNGQPDCGEPQIDEFDEILPEVHVDECTVNIIHNDDTCQFIYDEAAGHFFADNKVQSSIFDTEIIDYGAWIPDTNLCAVDFTHYDEEYTFEANCDQEVGFESIGLITATDILRRPVVFFNALHRDSIITCTEYEGNENIYDCMNAFGTDSLLIIDMSSTAIDLDSLMNLDIPLDILDIPLDIDIQVSPYINYASLLETNKYQTVQYVLDRDSQDWYYWHGHVAAVTNDENKISDKICFSEEVVFRYEYGGEKSTKYKYDIFTFSKGYENYYFYDQLDLADPVRTNLRDENGNTIMGGFGAVTRNTIYFYILSLESLLSY